MKALGSEGFDILAVKTMTGAMRANFRLNSMEIREGSGLTDSRTCRGWQNLLEGGPEVT